MLVSYPRYQQLGTALSQHRPDLEIRTREPANLTASDLEWAEVLVGFQRPPVEGWGGLRWIHSIGAGIDAFTFRTDLPPAVLLTRTSEDYGPQIGEFCLARVLSAAQHLRHFFTEQKASRWSQRQVDLIRGTRAVVLGTGLVGRGIAQALANMGVVVDGLSRRGAAREPFRQVATTDRFGAMVAGSRWLILAAPLTEETWHFLDRERLAQCSGAYLINVARGALVEEAALPVALDHGWLSGAALDVFEREPLPHDSPLWGREDVMISPHVAGLTSIEGAVTGFLESLASLERRERPRWEVDRRTGY